MNKEDLVYAAGIVDGEGQVTIDKSTRPRMVNPSYSVYAKVYNTNKVLTDYLLATFGGSSSTEPSKHPNHKDEHQWTLYGNRAMNFLIDILPFLRLKNKQAELCITLQKIINSERIDNNNRDIRENLYQQVKTLNKRGK